MREETIYPLKEIVEGRPAPGQGWHRSYRTCRQLQSLLCQFKLGDNSAKHRFWTTGSAIRPYEGLDVADDVKLTL